MFKTLLMIALLGPAQGQTSENRTLYYTSVGTLIAAEGLDIGSSYKAQSRYGCQETNSLLAPSGRFDGRSVGIKAGIAAATLGLSYWAHRKGHSKIAALLNFGHAAPVMVAGVRNLQVCK